MHPIQANGKNVVPICMTNFLIEDVVDAIKLGTRHGQIDETTYILEINFVEIYVKVIDMPSGFFINYYCLAHSVIAVEQRLWYHCLYFKKILLGTTVGIPDNPKPFEGLDDMLREQNFSNAYFTKIIEIINQLRKRQEISAAAITFYVDVTNYWYYSIVSPNVMELERTLQKLSGQPMNVLNYYDEHGDIKKDITNTLQQVHDIFSSLHTPTIYLTSSFMIASIYNRIRNKLGIR